MEITKDATLKIYYFSIESVNFSVTTTTTNIAAWNPQTYSHRKSRSARCSIEALNIHPHTARRKPGKNKN